MKHDFEEYFPLPWTIQRKGTWEHINSHNGEGLNICIMPYTDFEPKKAARQYLVQCANLMPEAVEVIKMACFSPCRDLCKYAKNGAPSVDVPECDDCPEGAYYERAKAFLAKLEGGEDDA